MHWIEPATAADYHAALEKKLWDAANMLWAGGDLKPSEYSPTLLGLIFLRYADVRYATEEKDLKPQAGSRRKIGTKDYHAAGVIYLPEDARFAKLMSLPEGANTGQAINDVMSVIEKETASRSFPMGRGQVGNDTNFYNGHGAGVLSRICNSLK